MHSTYGSPDEPYFLTIAPAIHVSQFLDGPARRLSSMLVRDARAITFFDTQISAQEIGQLLGGN